MTGLTYLSFEVELEGVEGGYRAKSRDTGGREAIAELRMPFSEPEIEDFWRQLTASRSRSDYARQTELARRYGSSLFKRLFRNELLSSFRSSWEQASLEGHGLRILLRLVHVPELANWPWEYLHDGNRFLALSVRTPVVRYLQQPKPLQLLTVRPPLRMLVMVASPSSFAPLDEEQEWRRLNETLDGLKKQGTLELRRLRGATLTALQQELRRGQVHIFHFIGHGGFDEHLREGMLILEDESGAARPATAEILAVVLQDHAPRLVVLNACEGARASLSNPFSGVAQKLIHYDVPAVVAMQTEVLDDFALALTRQLYGALADGYPIDACLAEARKALAHQCAAWGTPLLYMRSPDGQILGREEPHPGTRPVDTVVTAATPIPGPPSLGSMTESPTALEPTAIESGTLGEHGSKKPSSRVLSWLQWAAIAGLVAAVSLLAYERSRESSTEEGPVSAPPRMENETEGTARSADEDQRAATGTEALTSRPPAIESQSVAERSEAIADRPESEAVVSSPDPGASARPTVPPQPRPAPAVVSSWDRLKGVHRNERDGQYYVWIPQGSFRYGCSPGDDLCEDDEQPASNQEIEHGFWLGRTEVTVRAYKRFRDHRSKLPPAPSFNADWQDEAQPMVNVSRAEAAAFCEWAGARLPTEIEWEYAARAGEKRALPREFSRKAWFAEQSGRRARPVSQKEPNRFGLFDMLGNAAEWAAPRPDDPADTGIVRGGSWNHDARFLRFSFRLRDGASEHSEMYGFRCLADPS